jgi:signal transduction histidine kinase
LGLSIAKSLIEMHGGRIWAESTPGQRSSFCFVLPKSKIGAAENEASCQRAFA